MRIVGILLILVGLVAFIWGGVTYKREHTAFELGPIKADVTEKKTIPLPPVAGALALAAGLALVLADRRRA